MQEGLLLSLMKEALSGPNQHWPGLAVMKLQDHPKFILNIENYLAYLGFKDIEPLDQGCDANIYEIPGENIAVRISTDTGEPYRIPEILQNLGFIFFHVPNEGFHRGNGQIEPWIVKCEILPLGERNVTQPEADELHRMLRPLGLFWRECKDDNAVRLGGKPYIVDWSSIQIEPASLGGGLTYSFLQLVHGRNPFEKRTFPGQEEAARAYSTI